VASATLNVGQQLGGSIGTALLNTIATSAAATYIAGHLSAAIAAGPAARAALRAAAAVHGYTTAFWWTAGIFAAAPSSAEPCCARARWPGKPRRPPSPGQA